jgi:hypothetical protein
MIAELGFEIKVKDKYPDVRKYHSIFKDVKTPVCGHRVRECQDKGCNLYCKKQGE